MKSFGSGRRYAQALFELATADGNVDAWQHDLGVAAQLAADPIIAHGVDTPALAFAQRRQFVAQLLHGRVAAQVENLGLLLAHRGRFAILPDIAREYDGMVRQARGVVAATVASSSPLSQAELASVRARVEQLAGSTVELSESVDPSLIGGVRVTVGDTQIDASVASRLRRLRRELVQGIT
jgi:F-type H+-transporting ATPase subunit delta